MTKLYRDALIRHIKSSECIQDIVALIGMIGFSKIQTFLRQQILELNDNDVRKVYFNSLSMNDTLPSDIVGHVLSFNSFPHNNAIKQTNKQWNKHSTQIKAMQNKERKQVVDNYSIKYNEEVNNVWIVDQNRSQLTNDEIAANAKGPLSNLQAAIEHCESDDKLLIHDGVYQVRPIVIDKSIQMVGIGDNVVLTNANNNEDTLMVFNNNSISYIENIAFAVHWSSDCGFDIAIESNAKVTLNNCKFQNGIHCRDGASLDVKRCEFTKCKFAIGVETDASNVNVIGCTFEGCGLQNSLGSPVSVTRTRKDTLHLKCIGNVFRNNLRRPFRLVCEHDALTIEFDDWTAYSLQYNVLEGDRGILVEGKLVDANTIQSWYRSIE